MFGRTDAAKEIGVGAAVGGPLVLSTISYTVVGVVLCLSRRKLRRGDTCLKVDGQRLSRDQGWFLAIFALALALGLINFPSKRWLGLLLFNAYAVYVWREMSRDQHGEGEREEIEPLKFKPRDPNPTLGWAASGDALSS